jgi:hypothetical protein
LKSTRINDLFQGWIEMIPSGPKSDDPNTPEAKCTQLIRMIVWCTICLISIIFSSVIAYRLLHASPSSLLLLLQKFDFSQLLSLLLAFFSIVLSAAFYFKATESSNKFYDRTFEHTRTLLELLSRIEERTRRGFAQSKDGKLVVDEEQAPKPQADT